MEKLNRWVAKHYWLCAALLLGLPYIAFLMTAEKFGGLAAICAAVAYILWVNWSVRWLSSRGNALLKKPIEILQNACDPYPYVEEAKRQREFQGNRNMKFVNVYNEIQALLEIGEFEQAYGLLLAIADKEVSGLVPMAQAMYFSERLYRSARLQDFGEMEVWYKKLLDARGRVKKKVQGQYVDTMLVSVRVRYYHARQEYDQALRWLQEIPQNTLRSRVIVAWNYAAIHLGKGEKEAAKEKLEFVAQNANKLYIATEAKALLAKLNTEEQ